MKQFERYLRPVRTDPRYWDCECDENYIHKKSIEPVCNVCGYGHDECADSRPNEIKLFMAKKHFKALAEAIGSPGHVSPNATYAGTRAVVANAVANVCADFNPIFDRALFLEAVQKAYDRAN
tara:strand:- start:291 stop:656 length:366 start_codon:yes stop_codon:yes gene_type:complete